jgi:hypothetical protein
MVSDKTTLASSMNAKHTALFEALADAAGSGCELSEEWRNRLAADAELRAAAERFERINGIMNQLPALAAPEELRGRVVSTLQAGYREDRAVMMLRGLNEQMAPPELEALVAESLPGALHLTAPKELDDRVEAILGGWEGEDLQEETRAKPRPLLLRRPALLGLATAASLMFVVALATQGQSEHERERDRIVAAISTISEGRPTEGSALFAEGLLSGVTGGLSDESLAALRTRSPKTSRQNGRSPARGAGAPSPASSRPGLSGQSGTQASSAGTSAAGGREGADLLTLLADGTLPMHQGVRRVELSEGPTSPFTLIYREEISVSEDGRFAIDPLEILEPQMSPSKRELFLLMQKTREGFFYRHRDFRIRDLGRFLEQYTVTQSPGVVFVANRECLELDIRPSGSLGDRRVVCVDPLTGLCLRTQEFNGDGFLLGLYEYESLNLSPSFAAELSGGPTAWLPIAETALSTQVLSPLWIPEGYALRATEEAVDAMGTQWVRHRFTDGAEPLFFLHDLLPAGSAPTNRVTGNKLTRVWVHEVGLWTVVEGIAGDTHLIVLGKRSEADLIALLGSIVR